MIAVVAPEPTPWLAPVCVAHPDAVVFAPWARRGPHVGMPGWIVAQAITRVATFGRGPGADARRAAARLIQRAAVDRLAARWLPAEARVVIAPTLAARRTFASARALGAETWLVQDLPALRVLGHDLDRAARAHPDRPLLRNYRAPAPRIADQEAEWALTDTALVRSRYAADLLPVPRWAPLPEPPVPTGTGHASRSGVRAVRLAGVPTSRSGAWEAQAACARVGARLLVRPGTGDEHAALLARGAIVSDGPADVVVAPSWVEAHPAEVPAAIGRGVPVVATGRAAGWSPVVPVAPGDTDGLAEALGRLLG